jgi:hypothetical protein
MDSISLNLKKPLRQNSKLLLMAGLTAATITFTAGQPARADLKASLENVTTAMTSLQGIADTGVAIVIVPFGIGFALKIASHVLRAGT